MLLLNQIEETLIGTAKGVKGWTTVQGPMSVAVRELEKKGTFETRNDNAPESIEYRFTKATQDKLDCDDWFEQEHPGHDVHDHENKGAYERWQNEIKAGFLAGRSSAPALPTDLHDATTHRDSWLAAFDKMMGHDPENNDYWKHERRALERLLDQLSNELQGSNVN